MSPKATVLAALAVSALALGAGYLAVRRPPVSALAKTAAPAKPGPAPLPEATPGLRPASPTAAPSQTPPHRYGDAPNTEPALRDEPTLMAELRRLRSAEPARTLSLARQGIERFPNGEGAAERAWFVVKALTDLGRHDEARAEGRMLVERFQGTRFAEDVYRHLFVNPGTHPFERGYGQELESSP